MSQNEQVIPVGEVTEVESPKYVSVKSLQKGDLIEFFENDDEGFIRVCAEVNQIEIEPRTETSPEKVVMRYTKSATYFEVLHVAVFPSDAPVILA